MERRDRIPALEDLRLLYPELPHTLAIFEGAVETPYTIAAWLISPQELLEGETPEAWMQARRDPELLYEAARRAAAALAH